MKYRDGKKVLLGDNVLSYGQKGIIVVDVDSDNYSENFTKNNWESLKKGILIRFDNGALFHLHEADTQEPDELILIKRES